MVGEPADIEVESLEFDERNVAHLLEHDVHPEDVQAVFFGAPSKICLGGVERMSC